jgi:hypothetical protein
MADVNWGLISLCVVILATIGLCIFLALTGNAGCPAHTHLEVVGWIPGYDGQSTFSQPIYECLANG